MVRVSLLVIQTENIFSRLVCHQIPVTSRKHHQTPRFAIPWLQKLGTGADNKNIRRVRVENQFYSCFCGNLKPDYRATNNLQTAAIQTIKENLHRSPLPLSEKSSLSPKFHSSVILLLEFNDLMKKVLASAKKIQSFFHNLFDSDDWPFEIFIGSNFLRVFL
jgi:hypothetical protein